MFSIIHLSDIHFQVGHNVLMSRIDKMVNSVSNDIAGHEAVIIATTGDVAFSGKQEEYEIAKTFYLKLYDLLVERTQLPIGFVFIPGNHDCDFSHGEEEIRKLILEKIAKDGIDHLTESYIKTCCEPQLHYFKFVEEIIELTQSKDIVADVSFDHQLLRVSIFNINGKKVKFYLFNTSWASKLKEEHGGVKYPIDFLKSKIPSIDCALSISLIHHPLNWHTPNYSKVFLDFITKTSDFVFSGHDHLPDSKRISEVDFSYNTIMVESAALQESASVNSAFNVIVTDLESNRFNIVSFTYVHSDEQAATYNRSETGWQVYTRDRKQKEKLFQLNKGFMQLLDEPGAKYTHPTADSLRLSDIYVSPFLQAIEFDDTVRVRYTGFDNADNVVNEIENADVYYKILIGKESSGKTAFAKYYYHRFVEYGYFPIYVNVDDLNKTDIESLKKRISVLFRKQYDEIDGTYDSVGYERFILIIDDFHRIKNARNKILLLKNLKKVFTKILLLGNEIMLFETFRDKTGESVYPYEEFGWHQLKEFNPSLRHQLIEKWYRLGVDYMDRDERNHFIRLVDSARAYIDDVIGTNLVPAFPVYIMAILQGLGSGDAGVGGKQHAYYYEFLITSALRKVVIDKEDIGFYMSICREYFYFLFIQKIRFTPIEEGAFIAFMDKYKQDYRLSRVDSAKVLELLIASGILRVNMDRHVSPTYKYIYYYFVAKHLSDNLDNDEIKELVDLMSDRLYRDEFSNIIMFLIHLARNSYVVNKLLNKSRQLYSAHAPIQLDSDCRFINKVQEVVPELVYEHRPLEDSKKKELELEDENEIIETEQELLNLNDVYDIREDITNLDYIAVLTKALRTLDILGQLTKKYWGELKGEVKYNLTEETYLLGLRILKFHFSLIEGNEAVFVEYFRKVLIKNSNKKDYTSDDLVKNVGSMLFNICSVSTFSVFKRIVNAIGSEKLADTFDEVFKVHNWNSVALINSAIKLDHYDSFPLSELIKLKENNSGNILLLVVLRNFILEYLYMYDIEVGKRQAICEKFGIKMEDQRFIAGSSVVKR